MEDVLLHIDGMGKRVSRFCVLIVRDMLCLSIMCLFIVLVHVLSLVNLEVLVVF